MADALRGTWNDPKIVDDPRIEHMDVQVRVAAEQLHKNESLDKHIDTQSKTCVYCALRATRVLKAVGDINVGAHF